MKGQSIALLAFFAATKAESLVAPTPVDGDELEAPQAQDPQEDADDEIFESGEEFFTEGRRRASGVRFTIAFVSDIEANYRGHTNSHAKRSLQYIRDIAQKNIKFDNYNDKVDPKLVVHGGDINIDSWACGAPGNVFTCRTPDWELDEIWKPLYDAGIPTISAWGNHDWMNDGQGSNSLVDEANRKSMEFTRKTFERSAAVSNDFEYTKFDSSFDIGPDMYKVTFKGFQIGMFMNTALEKGYNSDRNRQFSYDTANALKAAMDTSKPAMFVSHVPIRSQGSESYNWITSTISRHPSGTHHFSGHVHSKSTRSHGSWNDYTASYPQWYGYESDPMPKPLTEEWKARKRSRGQAPGFYAILVDSVQGILEVKDISMEGKDEKYTGLNRGSYCHLIQCQNDCPDNSNNYEWDYGQHPHGYRCGASNKWGDGTYCLAGTSCNQCRNTAHWWYGKHPNGMYCGSEPCWGRGTACWGPTCSACCRGARQPWYWFGGGECK